MKTTISKTVTEEIELPEFPFYLAGEECAFKIYNENYCVSVTDYCWSTINGKYPAELAIEKLKDGEVELSNEAMFAELYTMVLTKIEENL